MVSKMFIKSKGSVNIKLIYQGKTGAVCKTQLFIFELFEDYFSRIYHFEVVDERIMEILTIEYWRMIR